jgi:signal transduction histidine kinase
VRSKLTIRSKFAAALAVPLAALAALAGVQVRDAWTTRDDVRRQADLATSSIGPAGLLTALQNERAFQTLRATGAQDSVELPVASAKEARVATDFALGSFRSSLDDLDPAAADAYLPALGTVDAGLRELRSIADFLAEDASPDQQAQASDLFGRYTDLVDEVLAANDRVPLEIDDATLRTGVELLGALSRLNDVEARLVREATVAAERQDRAAALEVRRLGGVQSASEAQIRNLATGAYAEPVEAVLDRGVRVDFVEALQAAAADPLAADADQLAGAVPGSTDSQLRGAQDPVSSLVRGRAVEVRETANERVTTYAMLAVGAVLLAILVLALANLWITRPLRRLAREARAMASDRLPEAVDAVLNTPPGDDVVLPQVERVRVRGGAEVAGVVNALNHVQESALLLAAEQAVLRRNVADSFVHLGRRNQNLLARQLELISRLEADERDAEDLEQLFKLDHLATRMRRNAESLLVLAGEEPGRHWSAPIDAADVVRAALGEVEHYRRVQLQAMEPATISGRAVADVSHILAELLDNALSFSPPESTVEVYGRFAPNGYALEVVDHGIGMTADDLARANQRLAASESFTIAPSRYLGHYVVAHLAQRHAVSVELGETPGGGVSASIVLPPAIVDNWVCDEPADGTETEAETETDVDGGARAADVGSPEELSEAEVAAAVTAVLADDDESELLFDFAAWTGVQPEPEPAQLDGPVAPVPVEALEEREPEPVALESPAPLEPLAPADAFELVEAPVPVEAVEERVEPVAAVEPVEVVDAGQPGEPVEAADELEPTDEPEPEPAVHEKRSLFSFDLAGPDPYEELTELADPEFVPADGPDVSSFAPDPEALPELATLADDLSVPSAASSAAAEALAAEARSASEREAEARRSADGPSPATEAHGPELDEPEDEPETQGAFRAEIVAQVPAFDRGLDDLLPQQLPKRRSKRRALPKRSDPPPAPSPMPPAVAHELPAPGAIDAPSLPRRPGADDDAPVAEPALPSMAAAAADFAVAGNPADAPADSEVKVPANGNGALKFDEPPPSPAGFFAAFFAETERGRADASREGGTR